MSESLAIRFDPPLLELDPILPFVVESEKLVTVYNDTDTDIEVRDCVSCKSLSISSFDIMPDALS